MMFFSKMTTFNKFFALLLLSAMVSTNHASVGTGTNNAICGTDCNNCDPLAEFCHQTLGCCPSKFGGGQ